jgi:hypothetical protein
MWERHRDPQEWQGLTVQVHDGRALGVVVGVFVDGPLAGRLRVHGDYTPIRHGTGAQGGIAVYAIPCQAVVRQHRDSLVLDASWSVARGKWLMHVLKPQVYASCRGDVGRMRE